MIDLVSKSRCFDGEQRVYAHRSAALASTMRFSVYAPARPSGAALFWLSGLTCTEENFPTKAGAQARASALGMTIIAPDTSPRGADVAGDPDGAWDFGLGAGFYVDATEQPYAAHYQMRRYVEEELFSIAIAALGADPARIGIFGHSMGGHGALTIGLRNPAKFRSLSAFAPIASPMRAPWGLKALSRFLGEDRARWRQYDACALIEDGARAPEILVDQGLADAFLETQLMPHLLEDACARAGQKLNLRRRDGFDHGYYFIQSFIAEHLDWHAARL
jgi:S-formylglutathione hydrolase